MGLNYGDYLGGPDPIKYALEKQNVFLDDRRRKFQKDSSVQRTPYTIGLKVEESVKENESNPRSRECSIVGCKETDHQLQE